MPTRQPLLELLCQEMGCEYLSDLRFLSPRQRRRLARKLEKLPVQEQDLGQWNDALQYLVEGTPEPTAREARDTLLRRLRGEPAPASPSGHYTKTP